MLFKTLFSMTSDAYAIGGKAVAISANIGAIALYGFTFLITVRYSLMFIFA